jgi:hypothetical protein
MNGEECGSECFFFVFFKDNNGVGGLRRLEKLFHES